MSPHTHKLRDDIRNIAIIAHVDHGKTTLVDALLQQSGTFAAHAEVVDRIMDAGLERERGITILAKNAACRYQGTKINIIDTPGHADFGGEVERGLTMVDGVLLLVDASEGPLPQTRFVLRKALAARLPVILVVNKVDRPDARAAEVVNEIYQLFFDLDADESQIDFPIVYTIARDGLASLTEDEPGTDMHPLFELILDRVPPPRYHEGSPFQARVANLDSSPYLGRLALCRVHEGELNKGEMVAWCKADGTITRTKITEMFVAEGLDRVAADHVGPGEVMAVAGLQEIMIGETIADADDPHPLPVIKVDEPSLAMTLGTNSSPFAGRSGYEADRAHDQGPARSRAGRKRQPARVRHRPAGHVGGAGPRRAAAGGADRADAARGLRAHDRQAAGGHARGGRQGLRAGGAGHDRRARGVLGHRDPGAGGAQGADGADDQPRIGVGAAGLRDPGPRPARVPHRVSDRDARHRHPASRVRSLRALARRDQRPPERLADRRPHRAGVERTR